MPGDSELAVALARRRDQLHDPGAAGPGFLDVIGGFLGPELPARVTATLLLLIRCSERDVALSLEPAGCQRVLLIASRSALRSLPWKDWWSPQVRSGAVGSLRCRSVSASRWRYSLRFRAAFTAPWIEPSL